mgnify:CR=1 FL=1
MQMHGKLLNIFSVIYVGQQLNRFLLIVLNGRRNCGIEKFFETYLKIQQKFEC